MTKPRLARPCATCGRWWRSSYPEAQYCSRRCLQWWKNRRPCEIEKRRERDRRPHRQGDRTLMRSIKCHGCGSAFVGLRRRTLCDCCRAPQSSPVPWRQCGGCRHRWLTHGTYCDDTCRQLAKFRSNRVKFATPITFGDCSQCGGAFVVRVGRVKHFCSTQCAIRASRSRRKAIRRTIEASGEKFTTREIAVRDGWRCHLCGKQVPDRQYAARDEDPTLDHLVPVSDGGLHVRTNVRLAHNRCNWERSTGGAVQLLLVG